MAGLNEQVPAWHVAVACGNEHALPQRPQLFTSFGRSKVSSTSPLQLLSMTSHVSGPVGVHEYSQPSACTPLMSKKPGRQSVAGLNEQVLATHEPVAEKKSQT